MQSMSVHDRRDFLRSLAQARQGDSTRQTGTGVIGVALRTIGASGYTNSHVNNSEVTVKNQGNVLQWTRFLFLMLLGSASLLLPAAHAGDVGDAAKLKTVLLDGKPVGLDQLKGKVVMVNFWATWCPTCRAEMPQWQKLYDAYKDKGFELIAVSIDEDEKELRAVAKQRGFTFPIAWRDDDKTHDNFGDIVGTPTLYVVDKSGKVAWTKRGGRMTYAQLQEVIEPLLKN
jgi:thiol-disulfide isomerase/thioredoxin